MLCVLAMKKHIYLIALLFVASGCGKAGGSSGDDVVAPETSGIVGKWATPCQPDSKIGYVSTINEFALNGSATKTDVLFSDNKCAGAPVGSRPPESGTYSLTKELVTLTKVEKSVTFQIVAKYKIEGAVMTVVPTRMLIDGEERPFQSTPFVLIRLPSN